MVSFRIFQKLNVIGGEMRKTKKHSVLFKIMRGIIITIGVIIVAAIITLFALSPGKIDPLLDQEGNTYPNGIAERVMIDVGDMELGAFLLGENIDNPILLYMHGGPGMPTLFMDTAHYYPERLEKYFTVCYLDQRGTASSYDKKMPLDKLNYEVMIEDTKVVTDYLSERFAQEKIYLYGVSWGTYLTTKTAHKYPDSYMAVINSGQVADSVRSERETYDYLVTLSTQDNDTEALSLLEKYNPDEDPKALTSAEYLYNVRAPLVEKYLLGTSHFHKSGVMDALGALSTFKGYKVFEKLNTYKSSMVSLEHVGNSAPEDILSNFAQQDVPFFIIMGEYDYQTTANLAKEFYEKIDAPIKEFVLFKDAAHIIPADYPQAFAQCVASVIDKVDINRDSTPATKEEEITAKRDFWGELKIR